MVQPDVSWFLHLALEQGILTAVEACTLHARADAGSLIEIAQAVLDEGFSTDLNAVQHCVDEAVSKATLPLPPGSPFADPDTRTPSASTGEDPITGKLPDNEAVMAMTPVQVEDFVMALLRHARVQGSSDLHLSAGAPPFWRVAGKLQMLSDTVLDEAAAACLNAALLTEDQREAFDFSGDLNCAIELPDRSRFRVNVIRHKTGINGTFHVVPACPLSLQELGFTNHDVVEKLLDHHNGLVLVTGPAGCGKSTTLAALVQTLNSKRMAHVITIEDPIEIIYPAGTCFITQRQVATHTESYASALKGALREDPDVIVIGELHDLETIEMAISASETGHLVIGTLHTRDAATTLNRLLGVFPPSQQPQIRAMVSESLRGVISQQFLPAKGGGQVVASELLLNNTAVANLIREGKTHHLGGIMQTGIKQGMRSMDHCVLQLFQMGKLTEEVAAANIRSRENAAKLKKLQAERQAGEPASTATDSRPPADHSVRRSGGNARPAPAGRKYVNVD